MKSFSAESALWTQTLVSCLVAAALLAACSDSGPTAPPMPPPGDTSFVASGQISVPAGSLHDQLTSGGNVSSILAPTSGRILQITLEDASGGVGTCDARCPSIDWSDVSGTFANQLTVQTTAGPQTFFLTETRGLSDTPDSPNPIWPFTELGGSTQPWLSIPLTADIVPGSALNLVVTMANRGTLAAQINWRVQVLF